MSKSSKHEAMTDLEEFRYAIKSHTVSSSTILTNVTALIKRKKYSSFESLPLDLLLHIYMFLPPSPLQTLRLCYVCQNFNRVFGSDDLWKPILGSNFPSTISRITKNFKTIFLQVAKSKYGRLLDKKSTGPIPLKMVVFGQSATGKTSLTQRFATGTFYDSVSHFPVVTL
jgi:hypothetical protein